MDMHSGGGRKTPFGIYFVEAEDEIDASRIFTEETGEDPEDVCCPCCGPNFSIGGGEDTLEAAAEFWARNRGGVDEYLKDPRNKVKVIRNGACPFCGREENGRWFIPCPSDDCPSNMPEEKD